jgi:hypothetical protein
MFILLTLNEFAANDKCVFSIRWYTCVSDWIML